YIELYRDAIDDDDIAVDMLHRPIQTNSYVAVAVHHCDTGEVADHCGDDNPTGIERTFHPHLIADVDQCQDGVLRLHFDIEVVDGNDVVDNVDHRPLDDDDLISDRGGLRGGFWRG